MSIQIVPSKNETNKIKDYINAKNAKIDILFKIPELEEIYPDTIEELTNIEKEQTEKQVKLLNLIKEAEIQLKNEQKRCQEITKQKELEIKLKKLELQKLKDNNQKLKSNLNKLQVETNKKLDQIVYKIYNLNEEEINILEENI